jgi:RNA polymerase sigma-32 factor
MDTSAELYLVLSRYGSNSHEHSRLSPEEALELYRRYRDCRDGQARRYLVRAHTRYVVAMALKYCQYGLPLVSLIAAGKVGILHALNKPDLERGHFLTYVAYWIRLNILNYVIHSAGFTVLNSKTTNSARFFKLRRERVRISNLLGEDADNIQYFADRTQPPTVHDPLTLESENVAQSAL